jgi:hypothetical protein
MDAMSVAQIAIDAMQRMTGVHALARKYPHDAADYHPDLIIEIESIATTDRYVAEYKRHIVSLSALTLIRERLGAFASEGRPLLVTRYLRPAQIDHCKAIDLDFIDSAGNCSLRGEHMRIHVRGNRPPPDAAFSSSRYQGGTSYAALRVIYALLTRRELLEAPYRDVAYAAGVSLGALPQIFRDLEKRALVSHRMDGRKRLLLSTGRMIDEWATNYPHKLRPRLEPQRFSSLDADWWRDADLGAEALWGGEVAAYRLTGSLRPMTQTIYVEGPMDADFLGPLIKRFRLRHDPKGSIEIAERFWNFTDRFTETHRVVNPLLIYADLLGMMDSRAAETATSIRKEFLDA